MEKLIEGIHHFQKEVFSEKESLFRQLEGGQKPEVLFITCSDSRINPNLLTQTEPGELFIIRNAGNIIPPHGAANGGEGGTIEYAIKALGIKNIIVCGHSCCGAMQGLLSPESLDQLPTVRQWLSHADATRSILEEHYQDMPSDKRLNIAIQENVLMQIENLRTHPCVASKLANGDINIYGWVYKFETGEVFAYEPEEDQFLSLRNGIPVPTVAGKREVISKTI